LRNSKAINPRSLTTVLVLGIWVGCASLGTAQTNPLSSADPIEEGTQLLSKGRLAEALTVFTQFKQAAPQDSRPYFYSGMVLTQMGQLSAAASELQEAVRLAPEKPEYHVLQADVSYRLKQTAAAAATLAIFDRPGFAEQLTPAWLKLLVDVYYRLEKAQGALRILGLLTERTPEDPDIDLNRGQVYVLSGRTDLALESFKKSIEKSPHNPLAYFEMGKICYQRNELAAAMENFLEAVRQDGTNAEYLYKLGSVCLARGEVDEAIKYLTRVESSGSALPQIYNVLGQAYRRKGDRIRADAYLKKFQEVASAEQKEEDRNWAVERLIYQGEMQLDQGDPAQARASFEHTLQLDPDRWDAHGYLAEMFLSSGDLELAYQHLARMQEIDPDSPVGNYLMAKYWYQRRDLNQALPYAVKVKISRPGNSELRNLLGNIYSGLGQTEKALEEYAAAVRLAPDRADFREDLQRIGSRKLETNQKPQKQ